ncbi:tetratricopeptide repeat protein [Flavobacteriaceae bacterium]|nr:tetratricopeptide repeat protein [Flavobacteriaceae bacterium]
MTSIKSLARLVFLCFFCVGFAQQSAVYTNEAVNFQSALALYNTQQYQSAQLLFKAVESTASDTFLKSNAAYYNANCAVRLNQPNAELLVESFVEHYPSSTKRNSAYFEVANYYFENAKYSYARKWFEKVDRASISKSNKEPFYFKYGYSLYATKNYKAAKSYLKKVETSETYGSQAKYYIGFMAYEGDDYDQATEYFKQVEQTEAYKNNLSYYQADLNFKLGKFTKAIELATAQLEKSSSKEVSELSKIIGESYFNIQQYSKAIPFLKAYKGKKGRWNHTDYYQLGYAYYKQNDYQNAINEFNKIIEGSNAIAQNAYYHLAESYVNLGKKQEALNAFRNASEMDFNPNIQEDAWLNYAKLSYDIGNPYQSTPEVLTEFLKLYPKSAFKIEVETLLIDSYISSNNFKEALELLENKSRATHKEAYQKVTFFRALEVYNNAKYSYAKELLNRSLSTAINPVFKARATYWKAESNYQLSNFKEALEGFLDFKNNTESPQLDEFKNFEYNLAYTYFKQKKYALAIKAFQSFISTKPKNPVLLSDSFLRLADSYFVTTQYSPAIDAYQEALKLGQIELDYATFQTAVSHGYLGQISDKITGLNKVVKFKKSNLKDQALFELANTYVNQGTPEKALPYYSQLIRDFPSSALVSKALLRKGLMLYNRGDSQAALESLNKVAVNYPSTPEAFQAISSSRSIYIDLGQVDAYAAWVQTLEYVGVTDSELDDATYEAAEKQYLDNNTSKAIDLFNGYIARFPTGKQLIKAHFYLAELYYKSDLSENALPQYSFVCEQSTNEFTEASLLKSSQIVLASNTYDTALQLLSRLELEANNPQNRLYAQSNLMKTYFQLDDYDAAIRYAELILDNSKTDAYIKSDAYIIIARAAMKTNNETKARSAYAQVKTIATGEMGAEAQYFEAYFKYVDGNYEASNESVQVLIRNFSSYKYFASKGLIIMAKNFKALDDVFQATYILENVIQNFAEFKEVAAEAQVELDRIKTEAAKTNSSIEVDTENEN